MIDFEWDSEGNWNYVHLEQHNKYDMYVNDCSENWKRIKYLAPNDANEMLGISIAPDGNSN